MLTVPAPSEAITCQVILTTEPIFQADAGVVSVFAPPQGEDFDGFVAQGSGTLSIAWASPQM
jgi:hypothetical protein